MNKIPPLELHLAQDDGDDEAEAITAWQIQESRARWEDETDAN